MNDISVTLSADDRALLQALREAGVSLDQFARKGAGALRDMETASHASATGIEKLAGGLKTAFIGGGVAAAIITIKNAIGGVTMAMIDAQMQADKVKNSLAFAMGGAQAAQEIQYLRQVTDQLGVSFSAVAPMYGRLAAATKGTNLEGRATREIFESIAQASVVMGLGVEETEGAMRALVQMVSKGQIQAEELRGQLGERLPRAFQIFADSMGVTTGELSKLLEMGQVGPERLAQFAATLKGEMAGNLDEATTRLAANVNRLDNAWLQLKQNVGEAGVSSFMAGQMAILADATGDVAKSMEAARKGGDGFLGQMAAAGGALLRFANPFNAITYNVQDQATELKIAQDQLREYEALLAKDPTNTFLIRGIAQIKETVAWLQAANAEKNKFASTGPSHRAMEDNSMKALAEQQAKAAKELADIKARLMGVDKDYLPTLNKLNDAYRAGNLTQKEYVGLVEELAKKNYTAAKSTATHADAFGDFVRKLNEKLAAQAQELDAGRKLTDSEKLRIQFAEELGTKYKNLSAAQLAKVDGLLKAIAAGEEQARATRRLVAAYQAELDVMAELDAAYVAASKAREQGRLAVDAYVQGIAASAEQVALEQSLFGQSARNRAIALEQYQIELDLKKQIAAINANAGFNQAQRDEEIARATAAAAIAKESSVAKADMAELQRLFDAFDNTAHDVFVNIFNDGSNAFKKLGQSLKAGLIDVLYKLTLKRWIINIKTSVTGLGGVTAANAASAGAGGLSDITSLLSGAGTVGSMAASWLGLGGATAAGMAANVGIGTAAGLTVAEATAAASAAGAAAESGLMTTLEPLLTAAPYLAAIAGVYMLAKKLDHSGTPHTGGGSAYSAASGLSSTPVGGWTGGTTWGDGFGSVVGKHDATDMTAKLVQSIVGILDTTATTFGKTAGYMAATSFADDSSKDPAWGSLVIKQLDNVLVNWNDTRSSKWAPRTFSDGSAGSAEYLAAISADVRKAIDGIGLPDWATQMLNSLGDAPTLEQLTATVDAITKTQATLTQLGASVENFAGLAGSAVLNIISSSGGLEAFATNLATFNEAFFSDSERFAAKLATLNQTLATMAAGGAFADTAQQFNALITEPTRANFRALVEAQDLTTTSGQKTYAALLGLSGVVAELTPAAQEAADAVTSLQRASTSMSDVFAAFDDAAERLFNATELRAYKIDRIQQQLAAQGFNVTTEAIGSATVGVLRSVMASFDLGTEQGRRAAVALSGLTGAILDLNASAAEAASESVAAFSAASTSMADVFTAFDAAAERLFNATELRAYKIDRIQQQLAAQGFNVSTEAIGSATVESLRAVMASFDLTTEPGRRAAVVLSGMAGAILDLNAATAETTGTLASMSAILSQRTGLSGSLATAIGDTALLRQRELAALDPSNRALQQVIYNITDMQAAVSALASQASASAASIAALQNSIAAYAQTAAQAQDLMNAISVAGGGADNSQAALWASVSTGTLTEQMATIRQLLGLVTQSIAADTAAAQAAMAEGARAAQKAIEEANAAQLRGAQEQLAAAEKMVDVGRQLRDYVQNLRIGNLSALTPAEKLALAASAYNTTLGRASAGDAAAMSALQGAAGDYLEQARAFDPAAYNAIFAQVTGTLDSFGGSLITDGQRQAAAATAQINELQAIAASVAAQTQAATVANVISEANAAKLAQLNELVAGIQAQAVTQAAAAQARLSEEQARAAAIATEQAAAQAALLQAQQQGRDALLNLPTVLNDNNLALIAEITRLNERIAALESTVVQVGAAQINTAVSVGAQTATAVADGLASAAHAAASTPAVV